MFWRKTRAAIDRFHPMHQLLISQQVLSTAQNPQGWAFLVESLTSHTALVKRPKWALPKRTLDVLVPLIQVLCQDVSPRGALGVTADLRGSCLPEKTGPRRQLPAWPPVRSAVEWYTVDPWLRLRADLRDGSVLDLTVVDRTRHRRVQKVSASGRHKTRDKTTQTQLVRVTRRFPSGVSGRRPAHAPPRWIKVKLRGGKRHAVTATGKLPGFPQGHEQVDRILGVAVEVFRWTPQTPGNRATGTPNRSAP